MPFMEEGVRGPCGGTCQMQWQVPHAAVGNTLGGSCRTVRARCAHGSIFLEYSPSFYPIEQPPQNHTQGPNFCTLQPLLA